MIIINPVEHARNSLWNAKYMGKGIPINPFTWLISTHFNASHQRKCVQNIERDDIKGGGGE